LFFTFGRSFSRWPVGLALASRENSSFETWRSLFFHFATRPTIPLPETSETTPRLRRPLELTTQLVEATKKPELGSPPPTVSGQPTGELALIQNQKERQRKAVETWE
jgi:hypothetical protein